VKRNKTDGRDAEAICEAMQRPSMRFVAVKSPAQQAVLAVHRIRELLVRQRTMAANALRAAFAEFGVVAPQGVKGVRELMAQLPAPEAIPAPAHAALASLARQGRRSTPTSRPWNGRSSGRRASIRRRAG
jgi:transposase